MTPRFPIFPRTLAALWWIGWLAELAIDAVAIALALVLIWCLFGGRS